MKAIAVFPRTHELKLIDHEEPKLTASTQVKARILQVGVCGTDKEICAFTYGDPPRGSDYLIIGHESVGEVIEVGSAVQDMRVGDLVVIMVRHPCSHADCRACRAARPDFCSTGDFTERGIKGQHGFMAEYVVDEAQYMVVVPPALRDIAALTEPLTIAEKAIAQAKQIAQRFPWITARALAREDCAHLRALVLGAGAIGLLGAMALRSAGMQTYVYNREPAPNAKSRIVEAIGATYLSAQDGVDIGDDMADIFAHVDIIYEATGASRLAFQAMRLLGPNSLFIFTGVPPLRAPSHVDTDAIMRNAVLKNQMFVGTVNAGKEDFHAAVNRLRLFAKRWPEETRSLITDTYPFDAYRDPLLGPAGGIKSVLLLDRMSGMSDSTLVGGTPSLIGA